MKKLLVICGPTATGKTQLGINLAKIYKGEIVSADSRQVYRKMDIATGKDLPVNSQFPIPNSQFGKKKLGYYLFGGVPVWMLDVVPPTESFSVAQYHELASPLIEDIFKRDKLPIIVGGTGFYIKALVDGVDTLGVPPNTELRKAYAGKTTDELYNILFHLDPDVANSLNQSERSNKQRLIRRIEIGQQKWEVGGENMDEDVRSGNPTSTLFVCLTAPPQVLRERLNKRIDEWVKQEAEGEVLWLLREGVGWEAQSMQAIGYRQWRPYFEGKATRGEVIKKWKQEEWRYARRQLTWFKKDKRIKWFDITEEGWKRKVEELVSRWYN